MSGFEFSEHIARSTDAVFAAISDPTKATKFLDNVTESTKLTDGPIALGTRFRETRIVSGKEATAELVISAYEPPTEVAISTEAEGIQVTYRYRLSPEAGGTRITWICELQADGLRKMMLPVVSAIMKKEDGDHLQKLKSHLEA